MVMRVEGRKLVIEIHLDEAAGMTGNGNILVASTRGWKKVEQDCSVSLNVVRKV
jgi:hypothetical protein